MSDQGGQELQTSRSEEVLVIDTSFGSTVGVEGHEPRVESDSRSHVEHLQVNIAAVVADAGLVPTDLDTIVVGVGPAPFTGLRAGIVTAKALAYATGAKLLGQDILLPQAIYAYRQVKREGVLRQEDNQVRILTLAVNDARRHQLYWRIYDDFGLEGGGIHPLTDMDIDYPDAIVTQVQQVVDQERRSGRSVQVVISGHGARRYEDTWRSHLSDAIVSDESFFDSGAGGLTLMVDCARCQNKGGSIKRVEPLYLRRPEVSIPNPLKHVVRS